MTNDRFNLPMSGASQATADGYDAYAHEYLSYGPNIRGMFDVAATSPDCAIANAHAGALHLAFEGVEGWTSATPFLEKMNASSNAPVTEREALFCAAVNQWAARDFVSALETLENLSVRWPADLCAIKWGQYHAFNLGDQEALLRLGERAMLVHKGAAYAHGIYAFALEQNHRMDEAEEHGMLATEIAIDDAWAHHAVAHVMETQGRVEDGITWLDHCAHTWERKGLFIREHNWWHAALFRLALGRHHEALKIFDEKLWGEWPEFPQEQIGAISMLWRLEMEGVDTGERWAPIVEKVRERTGDHIFPFHDLHYLFALARAGAPGEADAYLNSLAVCADRCATSSKSVWSDVCLPTARGLKAYAEKDFADAAGFLSKALPQMQSVGGSHAQRHIFEKTRRRSVELAGGNDRQASS